MLLPTLMWLFSVKIFLFLSMFLQSTVLGMTVNVADIHPNLKIISLSQKELLP